MLLIGIAAQAPAQQAPVAFDVVSIRPSDPDVRGMYSRLLESGLYTARHMTVWGLIREAYGFELPIASAPDWINTARFDISAKTEIPKPGRLQRELVKSLLADRFKFSAHLETREQPVYFLVMAREDRKLGALLRPAKGCDPKAPIMLGPDSGPVSPEQLPTCGMRFGSGRQSVGNGSLRALIINVRPYVDRPVLDRTGLNGNFDWDLQWENDPAAASTGVNMFSALQEQLGLKLEPGRGSVETLVVDRVEMPLFD